jgi:poly-gamma-glutamate synthase PgsB/CapB
MAIDPALQHASERQMIRATIGVITNVRLDHTEVMGRDLDSVAASLANTVPERAVLVVGDGDWARVFRPRAAAVGTTITIADPAERSVIPRPVSWHDENVAVALAVTRHLGIADDVARRGFDRAPIDPGALRTGVADTPAGPSPWADATAANDPASLGRLLGAWEPWRDGTTPPEAGGGTVLVYNHRTDRGARLACFLEHSPALLDAARLIVTGERPAWTTWRQLRGRRGARHLAYVATGTLAAWLRANLAGGAVCFCGNARGLDVTRIVEEGLSRG